MEPHFGSELPKPRFRAPDSSRWRSKLGFVVFSLCALGGVAGSIVAILTGGTVQGIAGLLISVPLAGLAVIIGHYLWTARRRPGKPTEQPEPPDGAE